MPQDELQFHDPALCLCAMAGECSCPCSECRLLRERFYWLHRLDALEERLKADGISPQDLADMVYTRIADQIQARIEIEAERLARRTIDRFLSEYQLKEKLAELLFADMVDVALGVQHGVKRNGRNTNGTSRTHGG